MDLGAITNSTNAVANTYAAKETKQADEVKKYGVTGKTIGQPKLSENAKKYYEELKSKYQNMDFILVSNDMKEMAKANRLLPFILSKTIEYISFIHYNKHVGNNEKGCAQ